MMGEIKIIGGKFKGRKLKVVDMPDLRPTPNRLRETLFNIIQYDLKQANCLDAFAGTGALGLEAYSRGAKSVVFLETNIKIYQQLKKNLALFESNDLEVFPNNCLEYLSKTNKTFDIIFLDPPFKQNLWEQCCQLVSERKLLEPGGLIYLESPYKINLNSNDWKIRKDDRLSDVFYGVYERI